MNKLDIRKRALILKRLTEGMSIRGTSRIAAVSVNTVMKLGNDVADACSEYADKYLRNLPCTELQLDELWSFVGCKDGAKKRACGTHPGDVWVWTSLCPHTKLIPSWFVGDRGMGSAKEFCEDLALRFNHRLHITSDGHRSYPSAIANAFGTKNVDFAQFVKIYEKDKRGRDVVVDTEKRVVFGSPNMQRVSTSLVERVNLTTRMSNRRFTRLTNAHSKKLENHARSVSLGFFYYNFCRKHEAIKMTPAMAAGVATHVWSVEDMLRITDAYLKRVKPVKRPKKYKVRKRPTNKVLKYKKARMFPKSYPPVKKEKPLPWYLDPKGEPPVKDG